MDIKIAAGLYFVLWWLVRFAVLPFSAHRHEASLQAPAGPKFNLWRTVLTTTAVATAVFAVVYAAIASGVLQLPASG
jgi:predicted secreted protein